MGCEETKMKIPVVNVENALRLLFKFIKIRNKDSRTNKDVKSKK